MKPVNLMEEMRLAMKNNQVVLLVIMFSYNS
jgi:hypothetical protein